MPVAISRKVQLPTVAVGCGVVKIGPLPAATSPMPSSASPLKPQQYTTPPTPRPQVCRPPVLMAV